MGRRGSEGLWKVLFSSWKMPNKNVTRDGISFIPHRFKSVCVSDSTAKGNYQCRAFQFIALSRIHSALRRALLFRTGVFFMRESCAPVALMYAEKRTKQRQRRGTMGEEKKITRASHFGASLANTCLSAKCNARQVHRLLFSGHELAN